MQLNFEHPFTQHQQQHFSFLPKITHNFWFILMKHLNIIISESSVEQPAPEAWQVILRTQSQMFFFCIFVCLFRACTKYSFSRALSLHSDFSLLSHIFSFKNKRFFFQNIQFIAVASSQNQLHCISYHFALFYFLFV